MSSSYAHSKGGATGNVLRSPKSKGRGGSEGIEGADALILERRSSKLPLVSVKDGGIAQRLTHPIMSLFLVLHVQHF